MTAASVTAGRAVVAALVDARVRHVVLAPGSRSAPLALAAAAAERAGALRLHVRIDERSAGYTALGAAKATGLPAAVITTSGTATANLLPAVVEARYSGVPLVVLTADRPPELRGRGASQTIDQVGMFDQYVVRSADLPVPGRDVGHAEQVLRAVTAARRMRGPVHLNLPFRAPLVDPASAAQPWRSGVPEAMQEVTSTEPEPEPAGLPDVGRGVILAGDLDLWDEAVRVDVAALAAARGWPIVAEAGANLTTAPGFVPHGSLLLADTRFREEHRAELVVTIGPFGLDRGVLEYVREADRHVAVQLRPRTDPPDPLGTADEVRRALGPTGHVARQTDWTVRWQALGTAAGSVVRVAEDAHIAPSVGGIARTVWEAMDEGELLFVASSLAIRRLGERATGPGPQVLANRGANGIDGLVSTVVGAASARGGRSVALLGDLALLHDRNGLLLPADETRPDLTFVVADNNGGGIFATLEQGAAEFGPDFDRVFGTPHDRDLVAMIATGGVPATRCEGTGDLANSLASRPAGLSVLVIETVRPAGERKRAAAIAALVADVVGR